MRHTPRPASRPCRSAGEPGGRRRARGNTLIEVLVSVLLFSFGLLGLVGMQARATQYSIDAEDRNRAAMLADELGAQMRLSRKMLNVGDPELTSWGNRLKDTTALGLPNADATIAVAGNVATVQITWKPPQAAAGAASSALSTDIVLTAEELGAKP